jgi:flagellar FliJ protein
VVKRKSERIKLLQKLAGQYEQLAARDLGRSTSNLLEQMERLEQLKKFRLEYTHQFRAAGQQGMDARSMMAFQNFLKQLDTAIAQQQQTVDAAHGDKKQKKTQWEEKHITTSVYDKTLERTLKKEQKQEDRKSQNAADEHAQYMKSTDKS